MNAAAAEVLPPEVQGNAEVQALLTQNQTITQYVHTLTVTTPSDYEKAAEVLKRIKGAASRIEEERFKITRPMDAAKKALMDFFGKPLQLLNNCEASVKSKMDKFSEEQKRIAAEAQARADAEARKQREKAEAAARETQRKADEAAAAARQEAERLRQAGEAEAAQKLEAKADKVEARAAEKIETLQQEAASVVAPVIQVEQPKLAGVRRTETWKFEVIDATKLPAVYLMPDLTKIGSVVKALKGEAAATIPGIRVWSETGIASGKA